MSFAQMEATAVLAVLLSSLRLRLRPGYIPQPKLRITLRPAGGMPMRLV
jgi:cytochrome P450